MIDAPAPGRAVPAPAWWSPWSARGATLAYTALALVFTWPLAGALARSLPWDMGDPVLNSWILAWSADHLWRFVTGDAAAFAGYWNANIFHPEPLALAYSEHLFAQAIEVLPVWAATRNPVLCYNLVLVGTFVLSGLGAFLLARDLTGDPRAAFVAGVVFGFAPYRIAQLSHVQVLSSQWMPLALFALRRHLATGGRGALAGFVAAMLAEHLSCGYYLVFFAPFAAAYAACEITVRRRWHDRALLARLAFAAIVVAAVTWPFLAPYLELRARGFPPRPLAEVVSYSANAWSYLTTHPAQWLWGAAIAAFPRPEGELFPGFVALGLAAAGVGAAARSAWTDRAAAPSAGWRRVAAVVAAVVCAASLAAVAALLASGPVAVRAAGIAFRSSSVGDNLLRAAVAAAVLLAASARARGAARRFAASPVSWFLCFAIAAAILSLGPVARAGATVTIREAPYAWLYSHVPGYDGLRVPARYAMLVVLSLSVLAAYGTRAIGGTVPRMPMVAAALALAAALEGGASPLPLDRAESANGLALPPATLPSASSPPPLYAYVRTLPADAVLAEFPFGTEPWEVRYMFASTLHWRRLVNGYSGGFPQSYSANAGAFRDVFRDPAAAWARLRRSGATHVVVHEAVFPAAQGQAVTAWLREHGARPLRRFDEDVVLQMPAAVLE